jgi:putative MATE family efflux protein
MIKETKFTEGKIFGPLVKFTAPVLFALILQAAYGAADLLIVGQFGTAADVSAVSTGTLVMHTVTAVVTSLAMGTTILMGQKIGQGRSDECGKAVEGSIHLFAIIGIIMTVAMVVFATPICTVLNVPEEAFGKAVSYVTICGAGLLFITAYNVMSSIMRGMGNSKMPLVTVAIACVVNIVGDLVLVEVFNLAATGAAIATVAAQGVSVIVSVFIIKKGGLPFSFHMKKITEYKSEIAAVIKLGSPIALQGFLVSLSFLVIGAIVNALGVIASAGVGVAEKLCQFIMLVPDAFTQALSTFVAQNIGAGKRERAKKTLRYGIISSLTVGVFMAYLAFFHGDILARVFTADAQVVAAAWDYLKAYAIDTILVSFMFCFVGYFNGCGRTSFVMIQGIVGAFGVRIPVAFMMSRLADVTLFKVALATPCSSFVQIILCVAYFIWLERKFNSDLSH